MRTSATLYPHSSLAPSVSPFFPHSVHAWHLFLQFSLISPLPIIFIFLSLSSSFPLRYPHLSSPHLPLVMSSLWHWRRCCHVGSFSSSSPILPNSLPSGQILNLAFLISASSSGLLFGKVKIMGKLLSSASSQCSEYWLCSTLSALYHLIVLPPPPPRLSLRTFALPRVVSPGIEWEGAHPHRQVLSDSDCPTSNFGARSGVAGLSLENKNRFSSGCWQVGACSSRPLGRRCWASSERGSRWCRASQVVLSAWLSPLSNTSMILFLNARPQSLRPDVLAVVAPHFDSFNYHLTLISLSLSCFLFCFPHFLSSLSSFSEKTAANFQWTPITSKTHKPMDIKMISNNREYLRGAKWRRSTTTRDGREEE